SRSSGTRAPARARSSASSGSSKTPTRARSHTRTSASACARARRRAAHGGGGSASSSSRSCCCRHSPHSKMSCSRRAPPGATARRRRWAPRRSTGCGVECWKRESPLSPGGSEMRIVAFVLATLVVALVAPVDAGSASQTFPVTLDRAWSIAEKVLKVLGWDLDKVDRSIGWITTDSRKLDGEDYGVYAKGTRHRLRVHLKA